MTRRGPSSITVALTWIASYGTTGASRLWSFILSVDSVVTVVTRGDTPARLHDCVCGKHRMNPPETPGRITRTSW